MFGEFENLVKQVAGGNAPPEAVEQATSQHLDGLDPNALQAHLQTAADNARNNGASDIAQQIEAMIQRGQVDPQALKGDVVALIRDNPQVLAHFAPPFAQGILSKVGL